MSDVIDQEHGWRSLAIAALKARETTSQCAVLPSRPDLLALVLAWPAVAVEFDARPEHDGVTPQGVASLDTATLLRIAWDGAWVDTEPLEAVLTTNQAQASRLVAMARALQLIYPDRSVHGKAQVIVDRMIAKELAIKPSGKPTPKVA